MSPIGSQPDRSHDLDRGAAGGGFELMPAEFRVAAQEWEQLVEVEQRRRRGERDEARASAPFDVSPRAFTGTAVPSWLDETERDWCARRHQLLADLVDAGPALRDTAACYRQVDAHLAATLFEGAASGRLTAHAITGMPVGALAGTLDSASGSGNGSWSLTDLAEPSRGANPIGLPEAMALWRIRSDRVGQLTCLLTATALAVPSWRGEAAQAYQRWLTGLIDAGRTLGDYAERVHHDLAHHELARRGADSDTRAGSATPPVAHASTTPPGVTSPCQPAMPAPDRTRSHTSSLVEPAPSPFLGSLCARPQPSCAPPRDHEPGPPPCTPPSQPDDTHRTDQPDDRHRGDDQDETPPGTGRRERGDTEPDSHDNCGEDGGGPSDDTTGCDDARADTKDAPNSRDNNPHTRPGAPDSDPDSNPDSGPGELSDEQEEPRREDPARPPTPQPGPLPPPPLAAPVPTPRTGEPPASGPGQPPPTEHVGPVQPTGSRSDDTALLVGVGATAAAAATAAVLLARRDRARTPQAPDITEIPISTETPPSPCPPRAPRRRFARRTPHPASPAPAGPAPDDTATEGHRGDVDLAALLTDGQRTGADDQPTVQIPLSSSRPVQAPGWLLIGTQHAQPALIDLAATHGLGLTGPGAAAVARAVLLYLLEQDPSCVFVAAVDTASALLGQPDAGPISPAPPSGIPPEPQQWHEWRSARLQVTPDPFTALQVVEAEFTRRRSAPPPPEGWPLWLLLVPAPTTTPARHRLHAGLTAGQPLGIGAILTSWWPPGWSCHIDEQHRITHHTTPDANLDTTHPPLPHRAGPEAPTAPADLVGAQLHSSTAAELRDALARTGPRSADDPGTPDRQEDQPSTRQPIDPASTTHGTTDTESDSIPDATTPDATRVDSTGADSTASETAHNPTGPARQGIDPAAPGLDESAGKPEQPAEKQAPNPAQPTTQLTRPGLDASAPPGRPDPVAAALRLSILGPAMLRHTPQPGGARTGQVFDRLGPRATELLVFLAVHPTGVHRDSLVAALWPDADRRRPTNALNATLARLRKTLRTTGNPHLAQVITQAGDRYLLDSDLIDVDYWTFLIAAADITHPDTDHRMHACDAVIRTYQGHLAADLTSEWLITLREATRRRYFDALTTLARLTIHNDPERTLNLLETARNLEPLKEGIYRDIMRIQAQLHRPDAAKNTLTLLRAQLADIDTEPDNETLQLAATIRAQATQHDLTGAIPNPPKATHAD